MIVQCPDCGKRFDDLYKWAVCPHLSLGGPAERIHSGPDLPRIDREDGWGRNFRKIWLTPPRPRIQIIFRWYDFWIGAFVDINHRRIYIFPLPMLGVRIKW